MTRTEPRLPVADDLPGPPGEVHLVGAGGAGMRALAVLLASAGWRPSGCDRSPVARAPEITSRGGTLARDHDPSHVAGVDLVVYTAAVPETHPELEAARAVGLPVLKRSRALGALVNDRRLVAVAGTHGKTTVSAMTALAAAAAGLDPLACLGGELAAWGSGARAGDGGTAVVEADEYDRAFLELDPDLALVTSLEAEHLECYDGMDGLRDAYRGFASRAAERDGVLLCLDDPGARRLGEALDGVSVRTGYGFAAGADYRVRRLEAREGRQTALLEAPGVTVEFRLGVPGLHNVQNAAGALAAVLRLGGEPAALAGALAGFTGVGRRLERLVDRDGVAVVDDYAHHPTEVRASVAAVRESWPGRRLVAFFQPHLYSRTRRMAAAFGRELASADRAWVLPVYGAREEPLPGVDAGLVTARASDSVRLLPREAVEEEARAAADAGPCVLLFMGAGDVTELARRVAGEVAGDAVGA